mgnify:CR=1 FL=1
MIKNKIINLIQEKREGSYWDFKAEYHKDNVELLQIIFVILLQTMMHMDFQI